MIVERAYLKNYRNYEEEVFEFSDRLNLILGRNAQGKTNLLEAIYLGALGKAFRTNKKKELLGEYGSFFRVGLLFKNNENTHEFYYDYDVKNKAIIICDEQKLTSRSELFGRFPMVLFYPDYPQMIKDGPAYRRIFMDRELSLLSKEYFENIIHYQRLLQQKNSMLRQKQMDGVLLDVLDKRLCTYSYRIMEKRRSFIEDIEKKAKIIHNIFTDQKEELQIGYSSSIKVKNAQNYAIIEEEILNLYQQKRESERSLGYSTIGPHTDDLVIQINGRLPRNYGSQGQLRLSALSIFFALVEYIQEQIEQKPIVLLDDVFSELDEYRKHQVLVYAKKYQSIITTTDLYGVDEKNIQESNKIVIQSGKQEKYVK